MLAEHGAYLVKGRIGMLGQLEGYARQSHQQMTQGREVFRLDYQPSFDPTHSLTGQIALPGVQHLEEASQIEVKDIENGFADELRRRRKQDIQRGSTSVGPHRDELRFLANQVDLGDYGSRGQTRTALLSLKFAEVELMKQRSGEWPVLLLDEVMAELDPIRRGALLGLLDKVEQAFVTTTDWKCLSRSFWLNTKSGRFSGELFRKKRWYEKPKPAREWIARLLIAIVLGMNLACAIDFIARPKLYLSAYELSGEVGRIVIIGYGILFLMWQVPYFSPYTTRECTGFH